MSNISIPDILDYAITTFPGTCSNTNWGERGIFYNPDASLPKGIYLLTIKEKDGPNDSASQINRGELFRLNLGISKASFIELFGDIPPRPAAGNTVNTGHNFQDLDSITPHPVYGWMSWIAVLNPSQETFDSLKPLLHEAYAAATKKWQKKQGSSL